MTSETAPADGPLTAEQDIQEQEYGFPYHYIPTFDDGFSQTRYWAWGYRYLGGITFALDRLAEIPFNSLIDIGCGDGRFLREVRRTYPKADLLGVDYSEQAIRLARAMNPALAYETLDVTRTRLARRYDVATLIEVLEHIPPADVDRFLQGVAAAIGDEGHLVLTVPHVNAPTNPKHYQHFSSDTLRAALAPHFSTVRITPFDGIPSSRFRWWVRLMGGSGRRFVITDPSLQRRFFEHYRRHYLYVDDETRCARIAAVCRK